MYRNSDLRIFVVVSALANLLAVGSFILIVSFLFYNPSPLLSRAAIAFLIASGLCQWQLYLFKVEIMEKKLLYLLHAPSNIRDIISNSSPVLVIYNVIFWITTGLIAFVYFTSAAGVK